MRMHRHETHREAPHGNVEPRFLEGVSDLLEAVRARKIELLCLLGDATPP